MSQVLVLPTPLSSSSFALGQLLGDPLNPESSSFEPSTKPACNKPTIQSRYEDIISQDEEGRFISSLGKTASSVDNTVVLNADEMSLASLMNPCAAFEALRRDTKTQNFLRKSALQNHAELEEDAKESVFAVKLMKVACRAGAKDAPHTLEDIDYAWTYHTLEEPDMQLSIGLGKALQAKELRALAGIVIDEDFGEQGHYDHYFDDEGLAGFSSD
ncbi:hypothetical protein BU25DRAFT_130278 [Macroventuria anomochaeta]|uniref:Uncharacterized protein n=1 Tax=Macroventuria anomochaeta TaxID=301207 RepID=A0ACB6RSH4_9PLEO|nr:uncharacterized protein BU25DRAFT_130278 [Macroventuria anomochaeta]KAF2624996.1 hypothetical protein BU25DRAFT_130278 [Macroventuria anomochaeta]